MAYDFPNTPTLGQTYQGYVWDGEKWLSAGGTPPIGNVKKNYIINGAMMISQENGSASITTGYAVDQFCKIHTNDGGITVQQVAVPTPGGSSHRLRTTVTVADTAVGASQYSVIYQGIEGLRVADLMFGTTLAKGITLRFGCKGPAGIYSIVYSNNNAAPRNYVAEYTISAGEANTDVVKTVYIPGDQVGTWPKDNTTGGFIYWCLMVGTTYAQAPSVWTSTPTIIGSTNQFNFMATVGNVFDLFDVWMGDGTAAPPYVVPDYPSELQLCLRYWEKTYHNIAGSQDNASNNHITWFFKVTKRAVPTFTAAAGSLTTGVYATEIDGVNVYKSNAAVVLNAGSTANARI